MKLRDFMNKEGYPLFKDAPIIREYEEVLQNKKRRFENGTWQHPNAKHYARLIIRYLFEEKLDYSFDDIKKRIITNDFKTKWKLNGVIQYVYNKSLQEALLDVYGEWIKPWEFEHSVRYLSLDSRIDEWLEQFAEEYLHFKTKEELITFFSTKNFRKSHNKVFIHFECSPFKAYQYFYENGFIKMDIRPYEFAVGYNKMWMDVAVVNDYLLHLLEENNIKNKESFAEYVSSKKFRASMKGLLKYFHSSPWELYQYLKVQNLIDFDLTVFDLKVLPNGFYQNEENQKRALRWLIYDKLKIQSKEEYIRKVSMTVIDKYIRGIGTYFSTFNDLHDFIEKEGIIPWHILPWEHRHRGEAFWQDKNMREKAMIWFFEEFLHLKPSEVAVDSFKVSSIWAARLKEFYQNYYSKVYENSKEKWVEDYKKAKGLL